MNTVRSRNKVVATSSSKSSLPSSSLALNINETITSDDVCTMLKKESILLDNADAGHLEKSLQQAIQKRDVTQDAIKNEQAELEQLFKMSPKQKSRETIEEVELQISSLELKRTITSMSLQEEKEILRQIFKLERQKRELEDYLAHEKRIQHHKKIMQGLQQDRQRLQEQISSLRSALSTTKTANQIGCHPMELLGMKTTCQTDNVSVLIGKKGSNVKQLMEKTGVRVQIVKDEAVTAAKGKDSGTVSPPAYSAAGTEKIRLHGTFEALELAAKEIEKVSSRIKEDVEISADLALFWTSKNVLALKELRDAHPDSRILIQKPTKLDDDGSDSEVVKSTTSTILLEGPPSDIATIKGKIKRSKLTRQKIETTPRQSMVIVGKNGSTIDRLVSQYQTRIQIERKNEDSVIIHVWGLDRSHVDDACLEINELLESAKEITHMIPIDLHLKYVLMQNSGALIKSIWNKVNGHDKLVDGSSDVVRDDNSSNGSEPKERRGFVVLRFENNNISIKGRAMDVPKAVEIVSGEIERLLSSAVRMDIDPVLWPMIIGKGGAIIQQLKKGRDNLTLDADRANNKLILTSPISAEIHDCMKDVQDIIDANKIVRITVPADMDFDTQFRDVMVANSNEITKTLEVFIVSDAPKRQIVLRGSPENVDKATEIVGSFMERNYSTALNLQTDSTVANDKDTNDTESLARALLRGGKTSKIVDFSNTYGVTMNIDRERNVLIIKGQKEKVDSASKAMRGLVQGSKEFVIVKMDFQFDKTYLSLIIGKGGKRMQAYEEKYPDLFITSNESSIILRGPKEAAENCRAEMVDLVFNKSNITQKVDLSDKQFIKLFGVRSADAAAGSEEDLRYPKWLKEIAIHSAVHISVVEKSISVRGHYHNVQDAVSNVQLKLGGVYRCQYDFLMEVTLFKKIRDTCSGSSLHFQRIKKSTGAELELNDKTSVGGGGSIVIRGKRDEVKAAKVQVLQLLEFVLSSSIAVVDIPSTSPLLTTAGGRATTMRIRSKCTISSAGAMIVLDRDLECFIIMSKDHEKVAMGVKHLKEEFTKTEKLLCVIKLDETEEWILPNLIIGKKGSIIKKLREDTNCQIDVEGDTRTIALYSSDPDVLANARTTIQEIVDSARGKVAVFDLLQKDRAAFIGKGGSHIKQLREKYNVEINITGAKNVRRGKIQLSGDDEEALRQAKEACAEWFRLREEAQGSKPEMDEDTITLRGYQIPSLIGPKGSVVRSLEEEFDCKVDIARSTGAVTVRSSSPEKRAAAIAKIQMIVKEKDGPASPGGEQELATKSEAKALSPKQVAKKPRNNKASSKSLPPPKRSEFPALPAHTVEDEGSEKENSSTLHVTKPSSGISWANVVAVPHSKVDNDADDTDLAVPEEAAPIADA